MQRVERRLSDLAGRARPRRPGPGPALRTSTICARAAVQPVDLGVGAPLSSVLTRLSAAADLVAQRFDLRHQRRVGLVDPLQIGRRASACPRSRSTRARPSRSRACRSCRSPPAGRRAGPGRDGSRCLGAPELALGHRHLSAQLAPTLARPLASSASSCACLRPAAAALAAAAWNWLLRKLDRRGQLARLAASLVDPRLEGRDVAARAWPADSAEHPISRAPITTIKRSIRCHEP